MKRKKNIASNSLSIQQTRNCHFIFYICLSVSFSLFSAVPLALPLTFFLSLFIFVSIWMSNVDVICCTIYTDVAIRVDAAAVGAKNKYCIFGPFFSFRFLFLFLSVCQRFVRTIFFLFVLFCFLCTAHNCMES